MPPGFFLASAIRSWTEATGRSLGTARMLGVEATGLTGARSLNGLVARFLYRLGLMLIVLTEPIISV
jgi:hypothetical protein